MNLLNSLLDAMEQGQKPTLIIKPMPGDYEFCTHDGCQRELGHRGLHSRS